MDLTRTIRRWLSGDPVYVRIGRDSIALRDVASGRTLEDSPVLAISKTKPRRILAVGRSAEEFAARQRVPFELANGFDHPRLLLADFLLAEKTLRHFLHKLLEPKLVKISPTMVLHPLDKLDGGLTDVEIRALMELAAGAGAREAYVWIGRELQDQELRSGSFKTAEGLQGVKSKWQEK